MSNFKLVKIAAAVFLNLTLALQTAYAQSPETVPFSESVWELSGEATIIDRDNRQVLELKQGRAFLKDRDFKTGVIEFDMQVSGERSFPGIRFRNKDQTNNEYFYIRPHQSGNPDASQYSPVFNASSAWQLYQGEGFAAPMEFKFGAWFKLRLDLYADSALISIDGEPQMHIDDLLTDHPAGTFGFTSSFDGALFSNLVMTDIPDYKDPIEKKASPVFEPGTVENWKVSVALEEVDALGRAANSDWNGLDWTDLVVEKNGISNLARVTARKDANESVIARFNVSSDDARLVSMDYAFSDIVEIFLNGQSLYRGDDSYLSRDYRFLGTIGFYDQLNLPLKPGANEVVFVVTEGFGGWAAGARINDPEDALKISQ